MCCPVCYHSDYLLLVADREAFIFLVVCHGSVSAALTEISSHSHMWRTIKWNKTKHPVQHVREAYRFKSSVVALYKTERNTLHNTAWCYF